MAQRSGTSGKSETRISPALIEAVRQRLRDNLRVRRTLPGRGRVHVDRQLPFLCVYRETEGQAELQMRHLVTSEAAYLVTTDERRLQEGVCRLVDAVAEVMVEQFALFCSWRFGRSRLRASCRR